MPALLASANSIWMNLPWAAVPKTSYYGPVVNPWKGREKLVSGGSSGGSAAAVATTSALRQPEPIPAVYIWQPAAFCVSAELNRLRPLFTLLDYGVCCRWIRQDRLPKDVLDCALLLTVMGRLSDAKDSTSVKMDVPDFTKVLGQSVKGLKSRHSG